MKHSENTLMNILINILITKTFLIVLLDVKNGSYDSKLTNITACRTMYEI